MCLKNHSIKEIAKKLNLHPYTVEKIAFNEIEKYKNIKPIVPQYSKELLDEIKNKRYINGKKNQNISNEIKKHKILKYALIRTYTTAAL
jgi:hypothetical protein